MVRSLQLVVAAAVGAVVTTVLVWGALAAPAGTAEISLSGETTSGNDGSHYRRTATATLEPGEVGGAIGRCDEQSHLARHGHHAVAGEVSGRPDVLVLQDAFRDDAWHTRVLNRSAGTVTVS